MKRNKIESAIRLYAVGGFGGVPGPSIEKTFRVLMSCDLPKEFYHEVKRELEKLRGSGNKKSADLVNEVLANILGFYKNWQGKPERKKKEKGVKHAF